MLTESILASLEVSTASKTAPTSTLPTIKDAGIYHLALRPHFDPKTVFKKSSASQNCVAVSEHHVFAAQADKAVVHVYSKSKGNQELTVPLGEKVTAIASAGDGGAWIVCGTESGAVLVWETYSGRLVKTQQSHIQAVTAIAVDKESNFFLTGSADSTVLVWSFALVLTYSQGHETSFSSSSVRTPNHTLTSHRAPITGLATGHSKALSNFAISIAEDKSAIVWHLSTGTLLRTYLLLDMPRALALDPADRACYIGYDDGSVQYLDFYSASSATHVSDEAGLAAPIQATSKSKWALPVAASEAVSSIGAARCMSLSLDGTRLLTGHSCGRIATWDIGSGRYDGEVCILPGSVSNIEFLASPELPATKQSTFNVSAVVKPKIDTSSFYDLEHAVAYGELIGNLTQKDGSALAIESSETVAGFSDDLLWAGIAQLQALQEQKRRKNTNGVQEAVESNEDFILLAPEAEDAAVNPDGHDTEADFLKQQVRSLQSTQRESFKMMRELRRERELLMAELNHYKSGAT